MAVDLLELLDPSATAVLTMELQRGVVGDLAAMPHLRDAVDAADLVPSTARLLAAARAVDARVIHCTAMFRSDRAGSPANTPFAAAALRYPVALTIGSPEVEVVPGLERAASDLESARMHGMSPFIGTNLDPMLRAEGIRTVVATGVSVNVGIFGLALEAVNFGYRVVIATDCVTGIPTDYAAAVLTNSLSLLATRITSSGIIQAWQA
ncbi:MAG: cysteine hydrolase family protein [bacterium]|nr:isochorismatase [Deltaproteobacteria bacterium]MCP4903573.1 cysteine hydrolase family protein [bacterium]